MFYTTKTSFYSSSQLVFSSTKQEGSHFLDPAPIVEPSCISLKVDGSMVEEKGGLTPDMINPELSKEASMPCAF